MIRKLFILLQSFAAAVVLARLSQGARRLPAVEPGEPSPKTQSVSVVIPARNEARRIEPCLEALSHENLQEILVVDDQSDDGTAVVAVGGGAKVINGKPLPKGYVGKPWAMQQGLDAATGDWVMFLDADTVPQPGLVSAAIKAAEDNNAHLLSLSPRFQCDTALEQSLHASMLATLAYRFGAVGTRTPPAVNRTLANGQCLLARRTWLNSQGGFQSNAGNMTDDIAFAREMAARGSKILFLDGAEVLEVKMHDSVQEVWREWGRSLPMTDVTSRQQQWLDLATIWLTLIAPLWRVAFRRATVVDRVLLTIRLALCGAFTRSYAGSLTGVFVSPLTDTAAAIRLTQATLWPVKSWRGRTYEPSRSADL